MNRCVVTLMLLLTACGTKSRGVESEVGQAASMPNIVDARSGSVGGIHLGMSESELTALGYPTVRKSIVLEGDGYVEIEVKVMERADLSCLFDRSGSLHRFSTSSAVFRDEAGSGVGTLLRDLKQRYPQGKLLVGDEDGRFANFTTNSKVIFQLDRSAIEDACFDASAPACDVGDETTVSRMVVDRYAN